MAEALGHLEAPFMIHWEFILWRPPRGPVLKNANEVRGPLEVWGPIEVLQHSSPPWNLLNSWGPGLQRPPQSPNEATIMNWVIHPQFTVNHACGIAYIIHFKIHNTIFINDEPSLILPFIWFYVNTTIAGKQGDVKYSFSMANKSSQMPCIISSA